MISDSEDDGDMSRMDVVEIDHFEDTISENDSIVLEDLEEQNTLYE